MFKERDMFSIFKSKVFSKIAIIINLIHYNNKLKYCKKCNLVLDLSNKQYKVVFKFLNS